MAPTNKALLLLAILCAVSVDVARCESNGSFLDWLFHRGEYAPKPPPPPPPPPPSIEDPTSMSRTQLKGWFKIIVLGTGSACFSKDIRQEWSLIEQFGEFASTEAFIDFFGEPECEPGSVGFAWGKVKASVVAAAFERGGRECVTNVVAAVITDPFHQFSHGDVRVRISGESIGEAEALCEAMGSTYD